MFHFLRLLFWKIYLWSTRARRVDRFVKLIDWTSEDPFKNGIVTSKEELSFEQPIANLDGTTEDIIEFFLQNSHGELVYARFARLGKGLASVSLYVRVGDKGSWRNEYVAVDQSSSETYAAGGIRLDIIQAMRRWRISYNGVVSDGHGNRTHLRAVFIGNYITGCGDYKSFHDENFLAAQLASQARKMSLSCIEDLDIYSQTFSMTGKIFVETFEKEVYLWGHRRRQRLDRRSPQKLNLDARMTGFTENGLGKNGNHCKRPVKKFALRTLQLPRVTIATDGELLCRFARRCQEFFRWLRRKITTYFQVPHGNLNICLGERVDSIRWIEPEGDEWVSRILYINHLSYDGNAGHVLLMNSREASSVDVKVPHVSSYLKNFGDVSKGSRSRKHVLRFDEVACRNEKLTGGKGSSLAVLHDIASRNQHHFRVPDGFCVTTEAYEAFASTSEVRTAIAGLAEFCGTQPSNEDLRNACVRTRAIVASTPLPKNTSDEVHSALESVFGRQWPSIRFAVRSSACGEDSADLSAAGQMKTSLGVVGFDALLKSISECWASQFSFEAVQYRRRFGQSIDANMSVVIQRVIPADVAGVMFTVHPVTGNPLLMLITANFGLGESVVSARADPDTSTLSRDDFDGIAIIDSKLGRKQVMTLLKESGGCENLETVDRSQLQLLENEKIMKLARVALLVENEFPAARDFEWAVLEGEVYLLQARPVTSLHQIDDEFEFFHEADAGLVSEFDAITKANVGEVLGGSVSTTAQAVFATFFLRERIIAKAANTDFGRSPYSRQEYVLFHHSQSFFMTFSVMGDLTSGDMTSRGLSIAMTGRIVDDEIVIKSSLNKKKYYCPNGKASGLMNLLFFYLKAPRSVKRVEDHLRSHKSGTRNLDDVRDIFLQTFSQPNSMSEAGNAHFETLMCGSFSNVTLLSLLASTEKAWSEKVYTDFASLVSCCNNIISAGVPKMMQQIAHAVLQEHGKRFAELDCPAALEKLNDESTSSGKLFREFLQVHGHRCLHEFDVASVSWSMDPSPIVKTLQSMISTDCEKDEEGCDLPLNDIVTQLTSGLSWRKKQLFKLMLARVRHGIALREKAKSCLIESIHEIRLNLRHLGRRMVQTCRLPNEDLIFHLLPHEILKLIETRDPRLVARAHGRMETARKAAELVYPEIVAGPPFTPINARRMSIALGPKRIKGTPVSKGVVEATARVICNIEDAHEIRKGDILVTYATDIGWSPYFPLLGGIVTELGGLISHGAVVAREFGLPCVVACHGATQLFKSGESIVLDGNTGLVSVSASSSSTAHTSM